MSETTINSSPDSSGEQPVVQRTDTSPVYEALDSDASVRQSHGTGHAAESQYPPLPKRTFSSELFKYVLSAVILLGGVAAMCGLYLLKEAPKEFESKELVPMVGIVKAMNYNGQLDKVISGTVVPFREIKVSAEVSGVVAKKYDVFEAGNFVKKGTKLIEIDAQDYELQLQTGLAEVEQSQKMLEETQEEIAGTKRNILHAQNEFRLAQSEHQRNTRIKNALSSSEIDQSKRSLLTSESALTTRKNSLEMLRAKENRLAAVVGAYQCTASTN